MMALTCGSVQEEQMRLITGSLVLAILFGAVTASPRQATGKTIVAVWAHADDEGPVSPVLARYAREGVQVYMITATDGAQGAANSSVPRGPEIAKLRVEEARCSAQAIGAQPPILLGFPDGALGNNNADPMILYRLTQRIEEELQRLHPDVLITWGPDGGYGHPDHRLISSIVTQLVRAGAPGVPDRLFYSSIPAEGIRAAHPERGVPPFLIPRDSLLTARIAFTTADFDAGRRSMSCHKTQFSEERVERTTSAMRDLWKGELPLSPLVPQPPSKDVFR
jgi:LmbE family N-acetylglucosaminyl deacetylase